MKIEFKWVVDNIATTPKLNGFENVITKIAYSYIATDTDSGESLSYPIEYTPQEPTEKFKSLNKLKEEDVISWVKNTYDLNAINDYLTNKLEEKVGDKFIPTELPWKK